MAELKRYTPNGRVSPDNIDNGAKLSDVNINEDRNGAAGTSYNMENGNGRTPNGNGSDQEEVVIKKKEEVPMVGALEVFRFSDTKDKLLMFIGSLFACGNGAALPCLIIVFGTMIDFMVKIGILQAYISTIPEYLQNNSYHASDFMADTTKLDKAMCTDIAAFYNGTKNCLVTMDEKVMDKMTEFAIYYCIIGGCVWLAAYAQVALWMTAAERQGNRIRRACLFNILRQDIGWFDTHEAAELNTKLSDDVLKIQDGIGDKVGAFFQWTAGFIAGFAIGFAYGWKMTLVILAVSPALVLSAMLMAKLASSMTTKELEAYGKAGGVAEEVFSSIRTVVAFGGQEKEAIRYYSNLDEARRFGVKKGFTNGAAMGIIWLVIFCCYALGFWYGGYLHREEPDFKVDDLIIVFFSVLIGAFSLGNASPSIQSMSTARGAAYGIYQLIDLKSPIDSSSEEGEKPAKVTGLIQFRNVHFTYPARPDVKILKNLSIEARPGQTVALVGSSGCGKSTTVQLLMRFYDPEAGQVMLDGKDIKDLNVKWLRKSIGLVSQEPVLFATTIADNIRYGREDVTMDEIVAASKNANAFNFIMELPDKFNTLVGERGAQLSGGQKQRIAIARALVRDPKILLLDEATSALDTESEAIVQDALDKARMGRTTLVIAHRLSTIKTADIIIGFHQGEVMEQGTHDELMAKKGIYHQLVMNQMSSTDEDTELENMLELQDKKKLERILSTKSLQRKNSTVADKKEEEEV